MPHAGKLRWTGRTIALPFVLSLVVHGLLFLVLWFWPIRRGSPTLTIQSTRISLDACLLDSPPAMLLAESELPADLLGPTVDIHLAPRLERSSRPAGPRKPFAVRAPGSSNPAGNDKIDEKGREEPDTASSGRGSLFPVPASAGTVVFVLDHSLSMGDNRKLDIARRELIATLQKLPRAMRFQVIPYNDYAEMLIVDGQNGLLPAEPAIVAKAISLLQSLDASGKTNHLGALCRGVDLRPDVLFFLTDADDLKPQEVAVITKRNQHTVVHTVELTRRRSAASDGPLALLAHANHGTCRRVSLGD